MFPANLILRTRRLLLRPARAEDAQRFFEILSNWNVVKMVRLAPHPYKRADAEAWIPLHAAEHESGSAFRFVIEHDGRVIGLCDVVRIDERSGSLGYWLDEAAWGQGIATEAAKAVVAFSFGPGGFARLFSSHAVDNPASGRVLTKLGLRRIGEARFWSNPRQCEIDQWTYELLIPPAPAASSSSG